MPMGKFLEMYSHAANLVETRITICYSLLFTELTVNDDVYYSVLFSLGKYIVDYKFIVGNYTCVAM